MNLYLKLTQSLTLFLDANRVSEMTNEELARMWVETSFSSKRKAKRAPRKKSANGYIYWSSLNRHQVIEKLEKSKEVFAINKKVVAEDGTKSVEVQKKKFADAGKDERNRIITTTLGHQWSELSDADKQKFKDMALAELEKSGSTTVTQSAPAVVAPAPKAKAVAAKSAPAPKKAPARKQKVVEEEDEVLDD